MNFDDESNFNGMMGQHVVFPGNLCQIAKGENAKPFFAYVNMCQRAQESIAVMFQSVMIVSNIQTTPTLHIFELRI